MRCLHHRRCVSRQWEGYGGATPLVPSRLGGGGWAGVAPFIATAPSRGA